ncbi:La-related protein like [Quillaja saponaria]|uniref:La-related protein like n=1 Tax=Quillaja saponaria TaxID=32244 RepID=A0AAD7PU05_QUISA|nr:La-related protein like [Quillaja saponaria]
MAQAHPEEKIHETPEKDMKETGSSFKFNAQAPEFVPTSHTQMPISSYLYPCFQILGGAGGSDWFYVGDQEPAYLIPNTNVALPNCSKNVLTDDVQQKIVKQVEYQFSDMSLLANEYLMKHKNKDPDGYVPISVIASTKKIKSLNCNNHMLTQALRSSSKLVLSDDGKKVKRKKSFTDKDKEELLSHTVVAENLPEDHSHQNLQKIFSVVGSVKTIRICHPQESNSSRSKGDFFISNKDMEIGYLHALVEYETPEIAERAVYKLNDERNWRKGLRVRLLLGCSPKSVLKNRKSQFEGILEEDEVTHSEYAEDSSHSNNIDMVGDTNGEENTVRSRKGWARGRGKGRGLAPSNEGRGLLAPPPQCSFIQCEASAKQSSKGPRMPDGTKGFTMGRGKPLSSPARPSSPQE